MKALVAIAVAAVVAATTAFAATTAPPLKTAGQLTVGFDLPAPGFWNGQASGTTIKNPTGFEHDLAVAIGKQMGISKVVFLRSPFGTLFSPATKKFDFALEEIGRASCRERVSSVV